MISESSALNLMHSGRPLLKMHHHDRVRWYVVPGGQVSDDVAARILKRPDVQPRNDGLFRGCDQTYQLNPLSS
jgi:hypothetical protein